MAIEIFRDHLVIRSWQASDAEELGAAVWQSLDHLRPWLPWANGLPGERGAVQDVMTAWVTEAANNAEEVVGIFSDGEVVGGSGLHPRIGAGGLEIGYWVRVGYTRRGIATAVSRALTDYAFGLPDIDRVEIHPDRANFASAGVPRSLGFSLVGETTIAATSPQQTGVHLIWRVTRAEWWPTGP